MNEISIIANFKLDVSFQTEKPCELYVDIIPTTPKTLIRILWLIEPNDISKIRDSVIDNQDKFDLILTYDNYILESCTNSKLFLYGTTWVKDFDFSQKKEYCITTLIGGKNRTKGHLLRHSLLDKTDSIKSIPIHLFNSINTPFRADKEFRQMKNNTHKNELFYSQFHVAIENTFSENWFSEKVIDCFQTKTVPIYFGCPNVGEYFDLRGMFCVSSLDEMINICNNINPKTYDEMIDYVNINYEISKDYVDYRGRIENEVKTFIKNL
jgi:hypothetical protein